MVSTQIERKLPRETPATRWLSLTHDKRQRSRALVVLDNGEQAELLLERGSTLRDGDKLALSDGRVACVRAAPEELSIVSAPDALALARAAYHLGNRHVALQIAPGRLAYVHDHVLDDMLRTLGLEVGFSIAPFEPEPGAYGQAHLHQSRSAHSHTHGQAHAHSAERESERR